MTSLFRASQRTQNESSVPESIYRLAAEGSAESRVGASGRHVSGAAMQQERRITGRQQSHHQNSSQLQDILNPIRGIRDLQRRQGFTPVDHAQHNRMAVKQLSAQSRQLRQQQELQAEQDAQRRLPSRRRSTGSSLPSRPSTAVGRDFVTENIIDSRSAAAAAARARAQREAAAEREAGRWLHKNSYGKTPGYLQDIKMELARQHADRQAAKEAALVPPGMRILEEEERLEMLAALDQSKQQTETKLAELPFVVETASQVKYKTSLEARMREVEEGLRLFSRTKVLVQADA